MAEKYEPDEWEAVVCNGFTAVNVLSSSNVEELGWDYTEMELDPTGTCGLFEGMLLDWDDDTPDERREHEEYFPDAFTVGARILVDDWDHELSNDEVRSRCFLIIEHADQFTDHDTGRDWLCESTLADFSEVEAMTSDRISGPSTARRPASSPRTSGSTAWRPVRARSLASTRRGSRGAKRSRSRRP